MKFHVPKIVNEAHLIYTPKVTRENRPQISSSQDAYSVFRDNWSDQIGIVEEFNMLLLDRSNRVMSISNLAKGGISSTIVDLRIAFTTALLGRASSIIIAHNHPSGNLRPSTQDIKLTKDFVEASSFMQITVFDHLILSPENEYYSFADNDNL